MMPSMFLSNKSSWVDSASFFQSKKDMFSLHFMNGFFIVTMLQMFFSSGAIFSISSASVEITPPVFGSSLDEIVPPVIIIAMFGRSLFCGGMTAFVFCLFDFSKTLTSIISEFRIPML